MSVQTIFNYIQSLNPKTSTVSSIGTFVTAQSQQISDNCLCEVLNGISDKDSLAYKIANSNERFSVKQLWVIAFELEKNGDFAEMVSNFYAEIESKKEFKRLKKHAKRQKLSVKIEIKKELQANVSRNDYKVGENVEHAKFGKGEVVAIDEETMTVNFSDCGEKKLLKKYVTFI